MITPAEGVMMTTLVVVATMTILVKGVVMTVLAEGAMTLAAEVMMAKKTTMMATMIDHFVRKIGPPPAEPSPNNQGVFHFDCS